MQQHLMQMQPMMAAYYPTNNVTTDHIQQYLDENKSLILKIVESQNSGKMAECAEHQAKLQRNLMYLAAIADSQPQAPALHSQYPQGGMMQQPGGHYMQQHQHQHQHQQVQQMSPQALMAARSSMLYSQQQYSSLQQQQALHSQLGMNSGGGTSGLHMLQSDNNNAAAVGGTHLGGGFPDFGRKQDIGVSGPTNEGRGGGSSSGGDGGETLYLKSPDKGN
ncbi:GRF1-interacting factor 1-like [Cynara cardunculus var. scolymus]|uniref:SSXT-like protein n=1 Tax=Cynara cardunculus var. scolymus TaxID=59895 RepID=A0A103YBW0_CYNCS|nr:GRF1-interacting factor 1-like [Cynara cardunculus var. scolymus]KVI06245.1 SSXT-like protein [Cynara cardunculus var. scolymus]